MLRRPFVELRTLRGGRVSAVRVGDMIELYDGSTAEVLAVTCTKCRSHVMHDECSRWAKVGERQWVSLGEEDDE